MKTTITPVRVKFVIFENEVLALFPNDVNGDYIGSYAHIGQHGNASKCLMKCKKATKDQYQSLFDELNRVGYRGTLKVLNEAKL